MGTYKKNRSGWEVLEASVSERTSGLHVRGINHETTDPLWKTFSWEINEHGLRDDRFDFSHTKFGPGAEARLELLKKRSLKRNARMKSLTFGIVPPYAEFEHHVTTWKNEDGEGIRASQRPVYKMELNGEEGSLAAEASQDIPGISMGDVERRAGSRHVRYMAGFEIEDVAALWAFINSLMHHGDDAAEEGDDEKAQAYESLASGIMGTLGYEWI